MLQGHIGRGHTAVLLFANSKCTENSQVCVLLRGLYNFRDEMCSSLVSASSMIKQISSLHLINCIFILEKSALDNQHLIEDILEL